MAKPILYGPTYSTFVRTIRMVLAEKNVDYDLVDVDMMSGEHRSPTHLQRHPFGKIPAFEHNGFPIYESNAIVHYIDDAFPGRRIAPYGMHRRARDQQIGDVFHAAAVAELSTLRLIELNGINGTVPANTISIGSCAVVNTIPGRISIRTLSLF